MFLMYSEQKKSIQSTTLYFKRNDLDKTVKQRLPVVPKNNKCFNNISRENNRPAITDKLYHTKLF